ncbi:MAG: hypothetical protein OES34_12625 [Nitrosopumilus sp.]|nr:hypothetical protein [Nitrosopumilus sp.]
MKVADLWVSEWSPKGAFAVTTVRQMLERNRHACLHHDHEHFHGLVLNFSASMDAARAFNRDMKKKRKKGGGE